MENEIKIIISRIDALMDNLIAFKNEHYKQLMKTETLSTVAESGAYLTRAKHSLEKAILFDEDYYEN